MPGTGGILRSEPEDFEVEELPAYLPSGEGDHLFLFVEKRGLNTRDVVGRLARSTGVSEREIGYAGMKDRRALTRQWFSLPARGVDPAALGGDGWRVLESARHTNKLRTGHLRGNRFRLRLRDVGEEAEARARAIADALRRRGLPNFYGEQRFGRGGANIALGLQLLAGERGGPLERARRDRFTRRLLLSSAQAALFNALLAQRLEDGLFDRALGGDLMKKLDSGGLFLCTDPDVDTERMQRFELSPTGPIFGHRMMQPSGEALAREQSLLALAKLTPDHFRPFGADAEGTRRALRIPVELKVTCEVDALRVEFELPKGSYATSVMREVMKARSTALADIDGE